MSVINQMLRDLDQRRASTLDASLTAGTAAPQQPVTMRGRGAKSRGARWRVAGLALVLVLAAGWWYLQSRSPKSVPEGLSDEFMALVPSLQMSEVLFQSSAPATSEGAAAVLPASAPKAQASDAGSAEGTVLTTGSPSVAKPAITPAPAPATSALPGLAAKPEAARPIPAASAAAVTPPSRLSVAPDTKAAVLNPLVSAPVPATTAMPRVPAPDSAVAAQRQQNTARDVLAQAQALYASGSADAAVQLLQDSLQSAEQANPPAPVAAQLRLVRELARMELSQGRASAVLELLGRLEPLLAGQADLWAVRANAAQRLGRHVDAVQYYSTALQSRPAEQRWLLGSAVSHAALGQLGLAAELAEKARAIAPVSKEVWAYLRQQGVALSERP